MNNRNGSFSDEGGPSIEAEEIHPRNRQVSDKNMQINQSNEQIGLNQSLNESVDGPLLNRQVSSQQIDGAKPRKSQQLDNVNTQTKLPLPLPKIQFSNTPKLKFESELSKNHDSKSDKNSEDFSFHHKNATSSRAQSKKTKEKPHIQDKTHKQTRKHQTNQNHQKEHHDIDKTLMAMGKYEKEQQWKQDHMEEEMEMKMHQIDKLMEQKKKVKKTKQHKQTSEKEKKQKETDANKKEQDIKDSMESVEPLGNCSSEPEDEQSVTKLYENKNTHANLIDEHSEKKRNNLKTPSKDDNKDFKDTYNVINEDMMKQSEESTPIKRAKTDGVKLNMMENMSSTGNSDKRKSKPQLGFAASHKLTIRASQSNNLDDELLLDSRPNIDKSEITEKNKQKILRMYERKEKKFMLLYPEDPIKKYWDFYITIILLFSCVITPLRIAFGEAEGEPLGWEIINNFIDICFGFDMVVVFCSAYYSSEYIIVEDRWQIASDYLKSWFLIDFISIFPIDKLMGEDQNKTNELVRVSRLGRLYRLVKLFKLFRILKIVKDRAKILAYLNEFLKIGLGLERLFFFVIVFVIVIHVITCIWIITAQMADLVYDFGGDGEGEKNFESWRDSFEDQTSDALYLTSFYFAVTTITTVGYGDISGSNTLERGISIVVMLIGVISFSFATGALSSIMQNYDQAYAKLQERVTILNRIYKDYCLPLDLYERLRQIVKYDYNKDQNDINAFVKDLPHKLKLEVSLYIHEETYRKINIFKKRSSAFIAWICPLLKPSEYPKDDYIFFEGDDVTNIFFLSSGKAGFVLPKYKNTTYIDVAEGDHFGIIDIIASILDTNYDLEQWYGHLDVLHRHFTIMSLKQSECLSLSVQDFRKMKLEFREVYCKLFDDSYIRLRRCIKLRIKAMKLCEEKIETWSMMSSKDGKKDSINIEDVQGENVDITNQIKFTHDEQIQMKGDELQYQIQAVHLNKIDEVSVEHSSEQTSRSIETSQSPSQSQSEKEKESSPTPDAHSPYTKEDLTFTKQASGGTSPTKKESFKQASGGTSPTKKESFKNPQEQLQNGNNPIQPKIKDADFNENMQFVHQARDTEEVKEQGKNLMGKLKEIEFKKRNSILMPMPTALQLKASNQSETSMSSNKYSSGGPPMNMNIIFDKIFSKIESMDKNQQKQFTLINNRIDELNQRINESDEALSNKMDK